MLPQGPIKQNITLVESYCMWCDLSVDRIYFSITNSSYRSNQCCPPSCRLGIYTASPVIIPLFKALPHVNCLKRGKHVMQFSLDHTKSDPMAYKMLIMRIHNTLINTQKKGKFIFNKIQTLVVSTKHINQLKKGFCP